MVGRRWTAAAAATVLLMVVPLVGARAETDPVPRACPAGEVPEGGFADVPATHATAVDCVAWYGVTTGTGDDTFSPTAPVTRGQLASLLHRVVQALGIDVPTAGLASFSDVTGPPHQLAVETLASTVPPVLTGYGDGTFGPGDPVTRGQLASILARLHDLLASLDDRLDPAPEGGQRFGDAAGDHAAAIEALAALGLLHGFADGTYGPSGTVSRGQVALVLHRWLDVLAAPGVLTPPDSPSEPTTTTTTTAPPPTTAAPTTSTTAPELPDPDANVGAASRSVMPLVGGSLDYLDPAGLPGPDDATSVGAFVEAFDDGVIDVGNGEEDAHWVRDDLRATAVAVEDLATGEIAVLVSADLYMLFNADVREIRERALALLPPDVADRTSVAVMTTHNHHGPDTAWNANHDWFEHMMDEVAGAAADAVEDLQPATLRVADGDHWFGMGDTRDAQVIDPTMNVLQARSLVGDVIATVIQWNNHPEVTLGWESPEDRDADCAVLEEVGCSTEDRYFTADYPGHLRRAVEAEVGGEVVYVVGALGGLVAPLRVPLWEVDGPAGVGLGNQYDPPPGAVPAGGPGFLTHTEANFRRAAVIGEQAALAALRFLDADGEEVEGPAAVTYDSVDVYTRLSNIGFRLLLGQDSGDGYSGLGHTPADLFTCPALGPKDEATCVHDGFATEEDAVMAMLGQGEIRVGDHGRTEVAYLRIGPVGMVFMPGEAVSELANGLPAGFDDAPGQWFEASLDLHADGAEYDLPGYVRAQMDDQYRWTVGMGNDEVGYIVPISDWRILCPEELDLIAGPGACAGLADRGVLDHPDSASGQQCKAAVEGTSGPADPMDALLLGAVCRYGQAIGEATSHYEETMAAGWDTAADMIAAVKLLTGGTSTERINPAFPGFWRGLPPPAG